jgi:dipeptidase D
MLNHFTADIENELKHIDKNVQLVMESVECPQKAMDDTTAEKIIYSLQACPHGVIGMSHEIEGLVETSTNLASVKTLDDNTVLVGTSQRSSIESCKLAVANQVAATFLLAGAQVTHGDGYPGWAPNADSPIMQSLRILINDCLEKMPPSKPFTQDWNADYSLRNTHI